MIPRGVNIDMSEAKDFDSFIKELVTERIEETPRPKKEEVWGQIITRVRMERKKERRKIFLKRLRPSFVACAFITLLTVLFVNFQSPVMALTNRIIKSIMVITGDTIKIYKKVDPSANDKTPDYLFGRDIDDPRVGEAQKQVNFRLFIPEYIPKDFKLDKVDVLNKFEKKETVTFLYVNANSDKKDSFEIKQRSFPNGANVALNIKKDDNTKIENITIDGIEYTQVNYGEYHYGLLWDIGEVGCEINGKITKEEIIEIAKSMK